MKRYHVNPASGVASLCRALQGNCPFGGIAEHFSSAEEARRSFEESHSNFSGPRFTKKKSVKLYHGSPHSFQKFSYTSQLGSNGADEGYGFYFTTSARIASNYSGYSGHIYEIDFQGRRAIARDEKELTDEDYRALLRALPVTNPIFEKFRYESSSPQELIAKTADAYSSVNNDADNVERIIALSRLPATVYEHLYEAHGYDHLLMEDSWGENELTHRTQSIYVVTTPAAIQVKRQYTTQEFQAVVETEVLREELTPERPRSTASLEEINYYLSKRAPEVELEVGYASSSMLPEFKKVEELEITNSSLGEAEALSLQSSALKELHELADAHGWQLELSKHLAKRLPRKLLSSLGYRWILLEGWQRKPREGQDSSHGFWRPPE